MGTHKFSLATSIDLPDDSAAAMPPASLIDAENVLRGLAATFPIVRTVTPPPAFRDVKSPDGPGHEVDARYQTLIEQIPAVVFMAFLDKGIGEAYVSPQIEKSLGFTQREWLEDPVRWYQQIHPEDKSRWSIEAAEMFLTGKPLRSAYRVMARDGRVLWFQCEAKMIRRPDGRPWFIHGVGFDITDLKAAEDALEQESSVLSAILDTVDAMVAVVDSEWRIVRFNQLWGETTGMEA